MSVANLGPRESRKRLWFGLVMLALGIILAGGLRSIIAENRLWRFAVMIPFWLGALNALQAKEKT
jgi:hypothetical protein